MSFNLNNFFSNINGALPANQSSQSSNRLSAFGGSANQLASDIDKLYAKSFYSQRAEADGITVPRGMVDGIPRSIFNQYALFNYRGMYGGLTGSLPFSKYRDGDGANYLMGGDPAKNVSVAKLINFFDEVYPKISYKAQDFLYHKYYKKIPVNHLLTLRRFPMPAQDNIFDLSMSTEGEPNKIEDVTQVAGVTAITYLGETAGNTIESLLNFSFGMNWKELKSEITSISTGDSGYTSQPFYNKVGGFGKDKKGKSGKAQRGLGALGQGAIDASQGVSPGDRFRRQNDPTSDRLNSTYANFVIGPINVIDKTYIRNTGLNFSNDIKLNFEYELKSLDFVNPKIAMIDIISNMLTMTTNNGQFFGGAHRYYGSAGFVGSQFGDISKLRNGDFAGYTGTLVRDVQQGFSNMFGDGSGGFDPMSIAKGGFKAAKGALGNILGGFLSDTFGSVSGIGAQPAFISGEPTGNWHVTVGNPLNPIVMMGNMICDNASMTFSNELGYDDFPMEVKFEIDLKHGKPRVKGDIENMFNAGRGRIYASAAGEEDILNLAGSDVGIYGAVPSGGTESLSKTQSTNGVPASDLTATNTKVKTTPSSVPASYTKNLVDLMINS